RRRAPAHREVAYLAQPLSRDDRRRNRRRSESNEEPEQDERALRRSTGASRALTGRPHAPVGFRPRRKRSATSSACCANLKARLGSSRLCSAPGVTFILSRSSRALSRRLKRVTLSEIGSLRIARSQAA